MGFQQPVSFYSDWEKKMIFYLENSQLKFNYKSKTHSVYIIQKSTNKKKQKPLNWSRNIR